MTPAAIRLECLKLAHEVMIERQRNGIVGTLHDVMELTKELETFVRAAPDFPGNPVGVRVATTSLLVEGERSDEIGAYTVNDFLNRANGLKK